MEFLSASHWSGIAQSSSRSREDAEAELLWIGGYDALSGAMEALAARRRAADLLGRGEEQFEGSLLRDPGMADSWLALFILECLKPRSLLERYRSILQALALCAERLGEEQERFGRALHAYYVPSLATRVPLRLATDARLLYIGQLVAEREHPLAELWLDRCDQDLLQATAAEAYLRLQQREFADSSDLFDSLASDALFRVESKLGGGMALAGMGLWAAAAQELEEVLEEVLEQDTSLKARYVLAGILSHIDPAAEREQLERVYAESPGFADVAARLGRSRSPQAGFDEIWRRLSGEQEGDPE